LERGKNSIEKKVKFLFRKTIQKLIVSKKKGFIFASAKTPKWFLGIDLGDCISFKFIENKIIRMTARIERYK
jgi:hypothetical protein